MAPARRRPRRSQRKSPQRTRKAPARPRKAPARPRKRPARQRKTSERARKAVSPRGAGPRSPAAADPTPRSAAARGSAPETATRRRAADANTVPVAPPPRPALDDAERRLLQIARHLTDIGREPEPVPRALRVLADAHAPDGALPRALFAAWAESRDDKTAALALAWAREQVRLAVQELVERGPRPPRRPPSPETLSWLLLAGAEAICQEPPSAAADRLRALLELAGHGEPSPAPPSAPLGRRELR